MEKTCEPTYLIKRYSLFIVRPENKLQIYDEWDQQLTHIRPYKTVGINKPISGEVKMWLKKN